VTSKQFLALFALGIVAVAALVIPLNMYLDMYGLFRSSRGRALSVYGEERIAKYLHSFRYVPENFDGILLGSSVSDNLDTKRFRGYRVYNASIDGGNVADLKPIAENVFRRGNLKLTIVCIHRYLTNDHAEKTDLMTARQYWGALMSPQLLTAYFSRLAMRAGVVSGRYDECGTLHYGADIDSARVRRTIENTVDEIRRGTASLGNYYIDPVALAELEGILTAARRHSGRMLVFYPPIPAPVLAVVGAQFASYRDRISGLLDPSDILVDFNDGSYAGMRSDYRNFIDGVHLSTTGARLVISELSQAAAGPGREGVPQLTRGDIESRHSSVRPGGDL
jgi:hypothetical protein